MDLVIVEAPGKCDCLQKALRGIGMQVQVMATIGHLYDNPPSLSPIALDRDLKETAYALKPDRRELVGRLRDAADKASRVYLAMDDDQEGDVIAWDAFRELSSSGEEKLYRVKLRAVSEAELRTAFALAESGRAVFEAAACNGTARRIIDRAIGASFSELDTHRAVGRVQSSLLAQLEAVPPVLGEFTVKAQGDGPIFEAVIPVTDLGQLPALEAYRAMVEAGNAQVLSVADVERPGSTPWGFEEIIVESAERLGIGIQEAADALQEAYEKGKVSYPRARRNGFSVDAIEVAAALAVANRCKFDGARLPRRSGAGGRVPHESPRPLDEDLILGRALAVMGTPDAVALLVARNVIECGQVIKARKARIAAAGVEHEFEQVVLRPARSWKTPARKSGWEPYPAETALLRYMSQFGLGRPSTIVPHVRKFLGRGLVAGDGPQPFALTPKGRDWLDLATKSGFTAETSVRIEARLEEDANSPQELARQVLEAHGMLRPVLDVIEKASSPVGASHRAAEEMYSAP